MARTRKKEADKWMPPRVYKGKSAYEYHPSSGKNIRLCALTASKAEVWIEYEKNLEANSKKGTVAFLIDGYTKDKFFIRLAPETQKDYHDCKKRIEEAFGKLRAGDLQPKHIRQFMDFRGQESESRANRERTFLSNVMSWGYERGYNTMNPCKGVKPFKIEKRDRYVTDEEYKIVYDLAPVNIQVTMEVAYLCAARSGDVRKMVIQNIKPEGLYIEQGKTGKKQIKRWTPRLRKSIDIALEQPSQIGTTFIIHNQKGQPYTASGLKGMFGKIIDKAMGNCRKKKDETDAEYQLRKTEFQSKYPALLSERFGLHDLKAKGISDYEGDKQNFSGHASITMMERYNRTPDLVDIVDPQVKK